MTKELTKIPIFFIETKDQPKVYRPMIGYDVFYSLPIGYKNKSNLAIETKSKLIRSYAVAAIVVTH